MFRNLVGYRYALKNRTKLDIHKRIPSYDGKETGMDERLCFCCSELQ